MIIDLNTIVLFVVPEGKETPNQALARMQPLIEAEAGQSIYPVPVKGNKDLYEKGLKLVIEKQHAVDASPKFDYAVKLGEKRYFLRIVRLSK